MIERLAQFVRTRFLGWARPTDNEDELFAQAQARAELARGFLDSDIVVRAYQDMLDRLVDELINADAAEPAKVLLLHQRVQSLTGLIRQVSRYITEVEQLDAERKKREASSARVRNAA